MKVLLIIGIVCGGVWLGWSRWNQSSENPVPKPLGSSQEEVTEVTTNTLRSFTVAEVAEHKDAASCYTIIRNQVYDVTAFIEKHPGGEKNILKTCGIDATVLFEQKHGGKAGPEAALKTFVIGTIVP